MKVISLQNRGDGSFGWRDFQSTITIPAVINTKIFDRAGRIYQAVSGSDMTTFTYYDNGNRSGITYPNGLTAEYTYYDNNKLCSMANKNGGVYLNSFSYQYDGNGNMTSKTEISGTTIYTYDDLNRLETVTEPGGKVTEYTFDEAGNRLSQEVTDGNDVTLISYTYNSQNELTNTVESLNGTPTEEKNYY